MSKSNSRLTAGLPDKDIIETTRLTSGLTAGNIMLSKCYRSEERQIADDTRLTSGLTARNIMLSKCYRSDERQTGDQETDLT